MADDDILKDAKEAFTLVADYEKENRTLAEEDLTFSRLGDQWDEKILDQRQRQGRPALTINKLPAFIRQVVNDARQNKPQIKVRPVDSNADPATANVINGLIRNIEQTSNADVAYDTAADFAVTMGFGYFRIDVDYAEDDTFEQDIRIERIANPFNVFGDPYSEAADSSDWNSAFLIQMLSKDQFAREHKGAEPVDWEETGYTKLDQPWFSGEEVMVAEWWVRTEEPRKILHLSDGSVIGAKVFEENRETFDALQIGVVGDREVKSHKIVHRLMTGVEILKTTEWKGRYIPLIPVYSEEVNVEGKRYFRSLIRDAKDAQRMFNYWRTATTELVALAPKAPFIGPENAFTGQDARKWETANIEPHSFLAFAGDVAPQRQPFAGIPAGALQEALNAADDMKAIIGLYDASLGARSNEVSGRAIMARQREGDVSTFHFLDNLARAIRHGGRVILDLIPHVYTGQRIIRTLGIDGAAEAAQLGQPAQPEDQQAGIKGVYDLTAGKYDLTVDVGPSYTTQRQESAEQMFELLRAYPAAAPVIGDLMVKNFDWLHADEIAERLRALLPAVLQGGQEEDPRLGQAMQMIQQLEGKLREIIGDNAVDQFQAQIKAQEAKTKAAAAAATARIKALEAETKAYDAETKRITALAKANKDYVDAASPPGPHDRYQGNGAGRT